MEFERENPEDCIALKQQRGIKTQNLRKRVRAFGQEHGDKVAVAGGKVQTRGVDGGAGARGHEVGPNTTQ